MSDIKKDTQKDVQYSLKDSDKPISLSSQIFSDKYHSYLSNKIERLTSALYVITGFLGHDEPVRARLRGVALDLVGQTSSAQSFTPDGVEAFRAKIAEITMLLRTAETAGLMSRMNAALLCEEYAQAGAFVKDHGKEIHASETASAGEPLLISDDVRKVTGTIIKDTSLNKGHSKNTNKKGHDYRRRQILALLDKKEKISIKDATDSIDGCSEKTVQRELLSLVEDGLVIKEGERRWSTYRKAVQTGVAAAPSA